MIRWALTKAATAAAPLIDGAFVQFAIKGGTRRRATRSSVIERIKQAPAFYAAATSPSAQRPLFQEPAAAELTETPVRTAGAGDVVDITWPSRYEPLHPSVAKTLERCPENATCHARWYRHHAAAPTIVCLHGWGAGQFAVEERAYVVPWLYRIGYDVVLATLPFHARRSPAGRRSPMFPSADPMRSNEAFAQAVLDIRDLLLALRGQGAPVVGVTGMSLGGFTTSLLATVEPDLDFAIPIIPFSSLAELMWSHGRGQTPPRDAAEAKRFELFQRAFEATAPLQREPLLDPSRILIIGAERDRVTPIEHAYKLHGHFVGSRLLTFPGGHLVQVGRGDAFREMARFLARLCATSGEPTTANET